MSARFQVVHFEPEPFSGSRVALGALVEHDSKVELVTGWLPGPRCLGGEQSSSVVRLVIECLRRSSRLGELPVSVGPQVSCAIPQPIPAGVNDPISWVREHVLPRRPQREEELSESAGLGPRRETAGYRFFETWNVAQWVKRKYRPSPMPGWPRPDLAPDISHYVPGGSSVLLLEPLVSTRAAFEKDLEQVSHAFLGWRGLQSYVELPRRHTLITYIQGGIEDRVREARAALPHVDRVFNVDERGDRGEFLKLIQEVGSSGSSGPLLQ